MTVLFGYSKKEDVTQVQAFAVAGIIAGALSIVTLFIVRNPKVKDSEPKSEVQQEEELQ